jgi:hypothetical protein
MCSIHGEIQMNLFLSYSHKDASSLDKLHTHLSILKRKGLIKTWFDRDILAGGNLEDEISAALAEADGFIALMSPDYIASDYCYDREMAYALERHAEKSLTMVPVIVRPCQWKKTPLGELKALPDDGLAVSEWSNEDRAYTRVVDEIFRLVDRKPQKRVVKAEPVSSEEKHAEVSKRRYLVKKKFDAVDKEAFREEAFEVICATFESEAKHLNEIEQLKGRVTRIGDDGLACTVVNRSANATAYLTVYRGGGRSALGDIYYSNSEKAPKNTANGWFSIEADDYNLYFEDHSMNFGSDRGKTNPVEVANHLWTDILQRAGVDDAGED